MGSEISTLQSYKDNIYAATAGMKNSSILFLYDRTTIFIAIDLSKSNSLYIYLFIYRTVTFIYLSIYVSIYLSIFLSIYISIDQNLLSICPEDLSITNTVVGNNDEILALVHLGSSASSHMAVACNSPFIRLYKVGLRECINSK